MPDGDLDGDLDWVASDAETSVLSVAGAIDASTGPSLRVQLLELVRAVSGTGRVARIDLADVEFIDSVGLKLLVDAHEAARSAGGTLELANVPANCRRVLEITRLDEVFVIRH